MDCLDGNNQALRNLVVVVLEEDSALVKDDTFEFAQSLWHFRKISLPIMTDPARILRTLNANLARLGIQLEEVSTATENQAVREPWCETRQNIC